jgi:hypothetical protein
VPAVLFNQGLQSGGFYISPSLAIRVFSGITNVASSLSIQLNKDFIFAARFNGTSNIELFTNSNKMESQAMPSRTPDIVRENFQVGSYLLGGFFEGLISEIIFYDRTLKTSEIKEVNNYLAQKYGIILD